eukprot:m.26075 g.26075  ORF g.26075 m.26075 type:complete len:201 (-) comp5823_c1_seq1:98-700(-)
MSCESVDEKRRENVAMFQHKLNEIIAKYSFAFENTDIVDLSTGEIIEDYGLVRCLKTNGGLTVTPDRKPSTSFIQQREKSLFQEYEKEDTFLFRGNDDDQSIIQTKIQHKKEHTPSRVHMPMSRSYKRNATSSAATNRCLSFGGMENRLDRDEKVETNINKRPKLMFDLDCTDSEEEEAPHDGDGDGDALTQKSAPSPHH